MLTFDKKLWDYISEHTSPVDPVLEELIRETHLKTVNPRMLSGSYQGKFLELLSKMLKPINVLEIGTFTGFSALCLAKGLAEGGKVHTIECNDEITDFARKYFEKSGLSDRIELHSGDALKIIPTLNFTFDLVFIDGNKEEYSDYYRLIVPKVKSGGIILADNVLWSGKVLEKLDKMDEEARGIIEFNTMIKNDLQVENILLPLRDGLLMIRKLTD